MIYPPIITKAKREKTIMKYTITTSANNGTAIYENGKVSFLCQNDSTDISFSLRIDIAWWDRDTYVFMPACVYNGNRFKKSVSSYPPMYRKEECGIMPEPVISDVPALNPDGSGSIEVTSGDLSVPCMGVFSRKDSCAFFVFTEQECKGKNIGFCVQTGSVEIQFPAMRKNQYRMCNAHTPSQDSGISMKAGEQIYSQIIIKTFPCESISHFYQIFFENRRILLSDLPAKMRYDRELWNISEEHLNRDNYSGAYYAETSKKWQAGWVGGGMSSLPLLKFGNPISKSRAISTIDFLTSHMSAAGFFYGMIADGKISDDGFGHEHMKNTLLIRKNGDVLYFLFKHFDIISPKEAWIIAAKRCADAFVRLFERYGDFGQFIRIETGDMVFGGTASGASAISALVRAWLYFKDEKYLKTATLAGEKYYRDFVARGITYGGPGEALCAPDSESAYALTESMILLYEATSEEKWLPYAEDSLRLFSSWVMPYAYRFPQGCEFSRLQINTVGSVFANVQNKHSAPGICTASGDTIYKIYRYTKNKYYLELLKDIVSFIPQCVSTNERPIYSWDTVPKILESGFICERVNTSDWESKRRIGEVFNGSCWPETSLLLIFAELIWNEEIYAELLKGI